VDVKRVVSAADMHDAVIRARRIRPAGDGGGVQHYAVYRGQQKIKKRPTI